MVRIIGVEPVELTVTVAVRAVSAGFAAAVTVIVLSFEPEVWERLSHAASSLTVQLTLDVILNACRSPAAAKPSVLGVTVRKRSKTTPVCVTLTVTYPAPAPFIVITAVRPGSVTSVIGSTFTYTVPLLRPEAGDTFAHEALLLTVQLVLETIVKLFCSPAWTKLSEVGDTDKDVAPRILKSFQTGAALYFASVPGGTLRKQSHVFTLLNTLSL